MTRFVHPDYPPEHAGVVRFERAAQAAAHAFVTFDSARGMATLLLAAIVSALLVVANELVDTWTEGHLLAAWVVMWAVAVAAIGLFAAPARRAGRALRVAARNWVGARRRLAQDRQLYRVALTDARVMADLSRAMSQAAVQDIRRND